MPLTNEKGVDKLNKKEKDFCRYYILYGNATRASIKAGYSAKRGPQNARELMTRNDIKAYIEMIKDNVKEIEMYHNVMPIVERRQLLTEIADDPNIKPKDRLAATDILNKMDSAYVQKVDLSGGVEVSRKFNDIVEQLGSKGLSDDD